MRTSFPFALEFINFSPTEQKEEDLFLTPPELKFKRTKLLKIASLKQTINPFTSVNLGPACIVYEEKKGAI